MKHFVKYPKSIKAARNSEFGNVSSKSRIEGSSETSSQLNMQMLLDILKSANIDTTKHQYTLRAEKYDRTGYGKVYTFNFTCPGDYLAYFSMILHRNMNKAELLEYIDDYIYGDWTAESFFDELPDSLEEMKEYASTTWWGDGDDYIYSLVNNSTKETLYTSGDNEENEEYGDDDWED